MYQNIISNFKNNRPTPKLIILRNEGPHCIAAFYFKKIENTEPFFRALRWSLTSKLSITTIQNLMNANNIAEKKIYRRDAKVAKLSWYSAFRYYKKLCCYCSVSSPK